jgi:hypothetical protein
MENYLSYFHYPVDSAEQDVENSKSKLFKVTTINWTFAGQDEGGIDYNQVHKNEYVMTLPELIDWIGDVHIRGEYEDYFIAEELIDIEPL